LWLVTSEISEDTNKAAMDTCRTTGSAVRSRQSAKRTPSTNAVTESATNWGAALRSKSFAINQVGIHAIAVTRKRAPGTHATRGRSE